MDQHSGIAQFNQEQLHANFQKIDSLLKRIFGALAERDLRSPQVESPGPSFYTKAATAFLTSMMSDPAKLMSHQMRYWRDAISLYADMSNAMMTGRKLGEIEQGPQDKRFRGEDWANHPMFYLLKRQYQLYSGFLEDFAQSLDAEDDHDAEQIVFFTRQLIDLLSPTNFLATNPDALRRAIETNGQSLVEGLENLARDLEYSRGDLLVSLTDTDAFEVGGNLATTEGAVVFENELFQLIHYKPLKEQVYAAPLLIAPPWINKFYILDLQKKNSMIRWLLEQGFDVYIISWRNPGAEMRNISFEDYLFGGWLTAVEQTRALSGQDKINMVGYCIGGTLTSIALAYLSRRGEADMIRSVTFFTTLTDFTDAGAVGAFIFPDFLRAIYEETERKGFLDQRIMARTFSFLRPNDLVYGPAIRSYLLGEKPPAFDILYWNGDSTRLPERMAKDYLQKLYVENQLTRGVFKVAGETISLKDIKTPFCAVAAISDHIAPWKSSFTGLRNLQGRHHFILAQSGHIAGIVNHPDARKYGYWTNPKKPVDLDAWYAEAEAHEGSWWPEWAAWLSKRSGSMISAAEAWPESQVALEPAPGSYVLS